MNTLSQIIEAIKLVFSTLWKLELYQSSHTEQYRKGVSKNVLYALNMQYMQTMYNCGQQMYPTI